MKTPRLLLLALASAGPLVRRDAERRERGADLRSPSAGSRVSPDT